MSAVSSAAATALLTWQPRAGGRSPAEDDALDRDAADVTAGAIIFGRQPSTSSRLPRAISFTQRAPRDPLASQDLESGSDLKTVSTVPHPQDKNLIGQPLELCRSKLDAAMGWDGSGFCSYSPRDVHQQGVCVMLSKDFREMSKFEDGLDIATVSGYVPGTGRRHWCLPVWAFAAAVERDPSNMEDLSLDCRRTNSYVRDILRQNFLLQGPSKTYQTGPAAKMLEDRCTPEGIRLHEQKRREREKWIEHEKRCLAKKYKIGKQDIVGWWDEDEHTCYEGFYDHNGMWNPYYMAGEWKRWCTTM